MSASIRPFDYAASLQKHAIPEGEYLSQHQDVHIICTGAVVFNDEGKILLVQRAKDEKAFPDAWEIPGGKMDGTDETILHAAARELKEETGLTATRVVRQVAQFTFSDGWGDRPTKTWLKLIFQFEVEDAEAVVLDPIEHQSYLWACEEEVVKDLVAERSTPLRYISQQNKDVKLEAFKLQREAAAA
ncbi:uncharacterized protein EKO05_0010998 [Ascochyta rabiei]|uniref:Hydrolase n=1 Tax=Didymella rabiei TaxID=5454 RepID=A0A163LHU9_DIDRA|nr:uncharacterized protein EKO05_0010998 [Ascochyta rabiei]KZM27812.1 hydrolase [Ascochyta rabiei]UPX20778.1 hypothetical protein EKO05_0010998 [Ascochyta rabiei]